MNSKLMQRQCQLNSQVLSGLYAEISALRKAHKEYNAEGDKAAKAMMAADEKLDFNESAEHTSQANAMYASAKILTGYIRKFEKKIAGLEQVQKALKHSLKCAQCMEVLVQEDDENWAERVFDDRHVVGLVEIEDMFRGEA
jgi:hypothetical protein